MVRLDFAELRRRATVADDGALTVLFAVAEPLEEDLFARNLVLPHGGGNVVDEAVADEEAVLFRVIVERVGHL